jgi:PAS domain S-box-containing protein
VKSNIKILLLEDNKADTISIERELKRKKVNFTLEKVSSEKAFIKHLEKFEPDLILSEYKLSKFTVESVLSIAQQLKPETPVIVVTVSQSEEIAVNIMKAGAWDYILKENISRLVPVIKDALKLKREKEKKKRIEDQVKYQSYLLENVSDAIISTDMDFNIQSWNKAAETLYGWKTNETIGKNIQDIIPVEFPYDNREQVLKQFFEKGFWKGEGIQYHRDGSQINVLSSSKIIENSRGDNYIVTANRDISERKRADESLIDSEHNLQEAQRITHIGSWVWKIETEDVICTHEMLRLWGYHAEKGKLTLQEVMERIHPEDRDRIRKELEKAVKNHVRYEAEFRIVLPGGNERIIHGIGHVEQNKGKPLVMRGTGQDVTERKLADKRLKESEEKYRQAVETLNEGIWKIDSNGYTVFVNPKMSEMLGYTAEEMQGKHLFEFMDDEWVKVAKNKLNKRQQGIKEQHEFIFRKKNGEPIYMLINTNPTFDNEGNYTGALAGITDITDRKKSEDALSESEHRFRTVIENLPGGVFAHDLNGRIVMVNEAACFNTGWTREELLTMSVTDIDPESVSRKDREKLWFSMKQGETSTFEGTHVRKDKSQYPVELYLSPVSIGGKPIILAIAFEISERKQAEIAVKESEEKFRALYDNAPLSYQSLNDDGTFKDVNPTWLKTLGFEREEVIGKSFAGFLHPDWKPHFEKNFPAFKKRGYVHDVQFKIRHNDGHYLDISFEGCIGYNPDGTFKQTYYVFQDITERKQAEEKLRESEKKLKEAQEMAHLGYWKWDIKTGDCEWSEETYKTFHLDPKKFTPKLESIMKLSPWPGDNERDQEIIQRSLENREQGSFEQRFLRPDGSIGYYFSTFRGIFDENDNLITMLGTIQDITERKQAEIALKISEEKFRGIYEQSPIAIEIFDKDGKLNDVNQKTLDMFGVENKKYVLRFDLWADPNLSPDEIEKLKNGETVLNSFEFDFNIVKSQNLYPTSRSGKVYLDMYSIPLMQDKKINGYLVQIVEVTERKKAAKELEESERKLSTLMSNLPGMAYRCKNDKDWKMLFLSAGCFSLTGYKPDELIHNSIKSYNDLIYPDDRGMVTETIQKAIQDENPFEITYRIYTKDKKLKWVWEKGSAVFSENEKNEILEGFITDVSERIEAEIALRESQVFNETMLNTTPDIIYIYDIVERKNVYSNDGIEKILGYSVDEIQKMGEKLIKKLMHPDDLKIYVNDTLSRYENAKDNQLIEHEYRMKHKSGEWVWLHSKELIFLRQKDGSSKQIFGIVTDITEQKISDQELEKKVQQLERSNKLFIDRESKMIDLKKEVNELLIEVGKSKKYNVHEKISEKLGKLK